MTDKNITPTDAMALVGNFRVALDQFMGQYQDLRDENARLRLFLVSICEEGQMLVDLVRGFSALPENIHAAADALQATIDALVVDAQ